MSDGDDPTRQTKGVGIMTLQTLANPCIPVSTRVRKVNVTITLDPFVTKQAKEHGLNISQVCQNALETAITALNKSGICATSKSMAGPAGFEPATTDSGGCKCEAFDNLNDNRLVA